MKCLRCIQQQGFPNFFIRAQKILPYKIKAHYQKKYHQLFFVKYTTNFLVKKYYHIRKWLYHVFFRQNLSTNVIWWYFFPICRIWWYFLYLISNKWWYFFQNGRIFLEKNTTKFENPLAHIKNTLCAHQMCAHITLGSPDINEDPTVHY